MKKYILLFVLIVNLSCNAQKKSLMIPTIDNKFEKFDEIYYNKIYNKDIYLAYETLQNGTYVEMSQSKAMKSYTETSLNSYYRITKIYYTSENIKMKGISVNTGTFPKGIWYEFDEQGKLIKETDYDKPFTFTFEDILQFCEKEGIKIDKGPILPNTGWHNQISRSIENGHPVWKIEYKEKPDLVKIIKLDGITGGIVNTETYKYINN